MKRILPVGWSLLVAASLAGCGAHVLPEIRSDAERLTVAQRLYDDGHYADAIVLLRAYVTTGSGAADVDQAIYLLGACYLKIRDWTLAAAEFERLLRDYPESDSSAAGSFRLGEALYGQSRKADFDQEFTFRALERWQGYLRAYPGHWLNPEAERRVLEARTRLARKYLGTGTLYLKLDLAEPARVYFRRVLEEFSETALVPDAELGLALADARNGRRGEAIEQLREVETRYPGQPVAERAARERRRLERR